MADEPETGDDTGTETDPPPSTDTNQQHDRLPDDHPAAQALKKANEEAAKLRAKVKEFEDADKTEIEKATTKAAQLEKDLAETTHRADRLEVALDKGLTLGQAKRLVGTTKEELAADADELLAELGEVKTPPGTKVPKKPKPTGAGSPKSGDDPSQLKGKERAAAALRQLGH